MDLSGPGASTDAHDQHVKDCQDNKPPQTLLPGGIKFAASRNQTGLFMSWDDEQSLTFK
ncbi:hypothetical protein MTO96_048173, partial [Rhipicephalus appendiculatus]